MARPRETVVCTTLRKHTVELRHVQPTKPRATGTGLTTRATIHNYSE